MKATCQQCQGNGHNECAKGYPHYGVAHICRGFEPKYIKKAKWVCISHDPDAPSFFRATGRWEE